MNESTPAQAFAVAAIARRRLPSLIWLVPVVAAAVGLWLVAHTWLEQGPAITIRFASAEGIEVGKTKLRYKEVEIGHVRAVTISPDRKYAVVTAQLSKNARDLLARDSKFFVVRPRISGLTVLGLSTLLSGDYIAIDPGSATETSSDFVGLDVPPVVTGGVLGREFILHAQDLGSLDYGTPVYYRRVNVGHVTRYSIEAEGQGVEVRVFINSPYDRFVTSNTHFWHASGVDISIDANGLKASTESLAALIEGGVAFQDLPDLPPAPEPAAAGSSFTLYADRAMAMRLPDQHRKRLWMYFPESVRGLSIGAPVDFLGIVIGEVKSLGVEYERGFNRIRIPVEIDVYPDRLRSLERDGGPGPYNDAQGRVIIDRMVAHGMRGQLRTGSLLTGQLYVALDFFPDAAAASVDWSRTPPVVPTVPGRLSEIEATVDRVTKKIDRIPIEKLSEDLSRALVSLDATLRSSQALFDQLDSQVVPEATRTFAEAEKTLRAANAVLAGGAPIEKDVQEALRQVAQSARSLAMLADYLERHPESLIRGKPEDPRKPADPR